MITLLSLTAIAPSPNRHTATLAGASSPHPTINDYAIDTAALAGPCTPSQGARSLRLPDGDGGRVSFPHGTGTHSMLYRVTVPPKPLPLLLSRPWYSQYTQYTHYLYIGKSRVFEPARCYPPRYSICPPPSVAVLGVPSAESLV